MKLKKGFTLIELLVVVAIIGILASLLLTALSKSKQQSFRAKCISNLKQLAVAIQSYTDDDRDRLPGPCWLGLYEEYDNVDFTRMPYYIAPYMGYPAASADPHDALIARCPAAALCWTAGDAGAAPMSNYVPLSYMANWEITNMNSTNTISRPFGYPYTQPPFNQGTNEQPKCLRDIASPGLSWALTDVDQENGKSAAYYYDYLPKTPAHGDVRNMLFFDWHIESARE